MHFSKTLATLGLLATACFAAPADLETKSSNDTDSIERFSIGCYYIHGFITASPTCINYEAQFTVTGHDGYKSTYHSKGTGCGPTTISHRNPKKHHKVHWIAHVADSRGAFHIHAAWEEDYTGKIHLYDTEQHCLDPPAEGEFTPRAPEPCTAETWYYRGKTWACNPVNGDGVDEE